MKGKYEQYFSMYKKACDLQDNQKPLTADWFKYNRLALRILKIITNPQFKII